LVIGAITSAPVSASRNDTGRFYGDILERVAPRLDALPIDPYVDGIVNAARSRRAVVVTAAPGAGKTTRVPPALAADGRVLLLQPRRVAARSIARRIALERAWTLGGEVGWHVRFERRFAAETRLIVATEGMLTARLQQDPLLQDVRTIVLDEFHERSVHADLGLAFAREAWRARGDLRIVVMSATMDAGRVSAYLGDCPVIEVPGRLHPIDISYHPGVALKDAVASVAASTKGAILCFLPGAGEIRRAADEIAAVRAVGLSGMDVLPLHGSLAAEQQDAALIPAGRTRLILATNLAETTVTVPDVTCVIDTGLQKVARYDAERGIDSLETERVSLDSADQRAGRAGRVQPGIAWRLWDSRDRLARHREPEIARVDLAPVVLDVTAWGGDPRTFAWYEAPDPGAIEAATALLTRLALLDAGGRLTAEGRHARRLALHPRLARMLLAARGSDVMARACALLSERHFVPPRHDATVCDLLSAVDDPRTLPAHVRRAADQLAGDARSVLGAAWTNAVSEEEFRRAVLAGYPDRVARRRAAGSDRFVLASGAGARLGRESGVVSADVIVATDVTSASPARMATGPNQVEALIRLATAVDAEWLTPTTERVEHFLDESGRVRAVRRVFYDALVLRETSAAVEPAEAARLLAEGYLAREFSEADEQLRRRAQFAGLALDFDALIERAVQGARSLSDVDVARALTFEERRALETGAPATIILPGAAGPKGPRELRLDYRADGGVVASIKLQHVFGLAESPRIGRARVPITFELLAPNGRPVQVTQDLASFWRRGYPEVRKQLRGRYPKHAWPEDPYTMGR
jgi:ATP-dependent helicase HrpB